MDIEERKASIMDMYYNPWKDAESPFEAWHLSSVKDYGRNEFSSALCYPSKIENKDISSFRGQPCFVLFSGGKESYLTCKILDHYKVEYVKIFINEIGSKRDSERHECFDEVRKEIVSQCGFEIPSTVIEDYIDNNRFGRNFPITYWYIMYCMERFGDINLFVGAEWLSMQFLHSQMKYEHSDILYSDINLDLDVQGSVYSIVNCLLEFDVYRLVKNFFGYDDKWSYYDHKKKQERMEYFSRMNQLILDIEKSELKEDVLSELEFIIPQYRLMSPIIYDFRKDISKFIERVIDENRREA